MLVDMPPTPSSRQDVPGTPIGATPVRGAGSSSRVGRPTAQRSVASSIRVAATPEGKASSPEAKGETEEQTEEVMVVEGTTIKYEVAQREFSLFLLQFRPRRDEDSDHSEAYYFRKVKAAAPRGGLDINCRHLHQHSEDLYRWIVEFPLPMCTLMDLVVRATLEDAGFEDPQVHVRPFNLRRLHEVRDLNPENIEQLVAIGGMVTRLSPVIPDLKKACYRCAVCGSVENVEIQEGRVDEPSKCKVATCGAKGTMELVHNLGEYDNKQIVRLQEHPDSVPEGRTPQGTSVFAFNDLVDFVRPGDRVEVTGVYRSMPRRLHPRITKVSQVFRTYVDVVHFRVAGNERDDTVAPPESDDPDDPRTPVAFSAEKVAEFRAFADDETDESTYDRLLKSVAPSIFGQEDIKRGILCMLFGGVSRVRQLRDDDGVAATEHKTVARSRGDINVLLCGDPGTSKSQMLGFVHKVAPRGVYTSGKGSSAVGLTVSVTRDPETRDLVMESGAVVLSDKGVCCIDEFDKMNDATRAVLHEAMEQQTISLAKAGIVATLNARTSILASANPVHSRYDPKLSVVENIQLPPTLLSRFDLIYLVLDAKDAVADRRLGNHLISLFNKDVQLPSTDVDEHFLRDYIKYARSQIMPEISPEARDALVDEYVNLRGGGSLRTSNRRGRAIPATPRQLEGMIRLSEALARMRLDETVLLADVQEAVRLVKVATLKSATDAATGIIDMNAIATGYSANEQDQLRQITNALRTLVEEYPRGTSVPVADIRDRLQSQADVDLDQTLFARALKDLVDDDLVQHNRRNAVIVRR